MTDQSQNDAIAKAIGRIPSGCAILTAKANGRQTGMLVSWFQQAGFDPPAISVGIKKGRHIEQLVDSAGGFVLNILPEDPTPMFKHFGKGFAETEDAFVGLNTSEMKFGIGLENALARISGRVRGKCDAGDHWLFVAEVIDAEIGEIAKPYIHLRKNGL